MPRTANKSDLNQESDQIEVTYMAIRERLMEYFKGTSVHRTVEHGSLKLQEIPAGRLTHQYQRFDRERDKPRVMVLQGLPLLELHASPATVVFYKTVMDRSPQLQELYKRIVEFFGTYLPHTKVEHRKGVIYAD